MPFGSLDLEGVSDYLIWYARDKSKLKYRQLFEEKNVEGDSHWNYADLPDGSRIKLNTEQINNHKLLPPVADLIQLKGHYQAGINKSSLFEIEFIGKKYSPPSGNSCKTNKEGIIKLIEAYRRIVSLSFEASEHKRIAVKIVDDRGIESLKIVEL